MGGRERRSLTGKVRPPQRDTSGVAHDRRQSGLVGVLCLSAWLAESVILRPSGEGRENGECLLVVNTRCVRDTYVFWKLLALAGSPLLKVWIFQIDLDTMRRIVSIIWTHLEWRMRVLDLRHLRRFLNRGWGRVISQAIQCTTSSIRERRLATIAC